MLYRTVVGSIPSVLRVKRIIREFQPDVVITDADPICHYAAHSVKGLPRISIDNPHAMVYRTYKVGWSQLLPWFVLVVATRIGMMGADKYIVYDFSDEPSTTPQVIFIKPLIQEGIQQQKSRQGRHVFVYQTIGVDSSSLEALKQVDATFIIYGFNKEEKHGNLVFKRFNEHEFYHDIAEAKAVITNGGFTVISEALYLKKSVLSLPIKNQFEQVLNGMFVKQLGVGEYHLKVDAETVQSFLSRLPQYQQQLDQYTPGNQQQLLQRIEQEILATVKQSS